MHDERIPTYDQPNLRAAHIIPWRYFFKPDRSLMPSSTSPKDDIVTEIVVRVNTARRSALIHSSGKNVGGLQGGRERRCETAGPGDQERGLYHRERGIRESADIAKAIALGADAVYIGTAALVAMGCRVCGSCYRGLCPPGGDCHAA